jgi:cyanate permease
MAIQFGFSAVGLYLLPTWLPVIHVSGLFLGFALLDIAALFVIFSVPDKHQPLGQVHNAPLELHVLLAKTSVLCLLAIGVYEAANMAQFTYVERIGVSIGLNADELGIALGIATLVGIPAGFGVALIGDRFGHFKPIAAAAVIQVLALSILIADPGQAGYLFAMCLIGAGWAFALPYFQAIEAAIDRGGSVVVAGSFATGFAGFVGPAVAAMLVGPEGYSRMLIAAIAGYLLSVVLIRTVTTRTTA